MHGIEVDPNLNTTIKGLIPVKLVRIIPQGEKTELIRGVCKEFEEKYIHYYSIKKEGFKK